MPNKSNNSGHNSTTLSQQLPLPEYTLLTPQAMAQNGLGTPNFGLLELIFTECIQDA